MSVGAFVCGCSGQRITSAELEFLRRTQPWGLILFRRNIGSPQDVRSLIGHFREAVGRDDAPVLVDQEGGRVQRLAPPTWPSYPPAAAFDRLVGDDSQKAAMAQLSARLMAFDLAALGITIDCMPVLDVPSPDAHGIIGDRGYASEPRLVTILARAAAAGLLAGGVLPVIKHIPGHGRARADSHLELPVVEADREKLSRVDFAPFRDLNDLPIAMTAHVVYTALDPDRPATTSRIVIDRVVRGEIGFHGLLLSDDLSMKALSGGMRERASAARRAGVDIALHCNGDLMEAEGVAEGAGPLEGGAERRARAALALSRAAPVDFDRGQARAALDAALTLVA